MTSASDRDLHGHRTGAAFGATTLGGIAAAGTGAVAVAGTAVVAAGAVGYGIGTAINKLAVEPLADWLAIGCGSFGDWYLQDVPD